MHVQEIVFTPQIWQVLQQLLYDTWLHTRFQLNRTSSFGYTKSGCARAHVQRHPECGACFSNCCMLLAYIQSFSPIGPVVSEIQKRGVHVRTCDNAQNLRVRHYQLYDTCLYTKFQSNRISSFGDRKKGFARAHVRQHPKSERRVTICFVMPGHIPNVSKIGPVVSEIRKRGVHVRTCGSTPSLRCASVSGVWYPYACKI